MLLIALHYLCCLSCCCHCGRAQHGLPAPIIACPSAVRLQKCLPLSWPFLHAHERGRIVIKAHWYLVIYWFRSRPLLITGMEP